MSIKLHKTIEPIVEEPTPEEKEEKVSLLFPFINSVTHKKNNLFEDPSLDPVFVEKQYGQMSYIINRSLSQFPDTLFHAQNMNQYSLLDAKMQYLYLLHSIPKKFRKSDKWLRAEKIEHLEIIKSYYGFSDKKARKALEILSDKDIKYIQSKLETGGVIKKKPREK